MSERNCDRDLYDENDLLVYGISVKNGMTYARGDMEMYLELVRMFLRERTKQDIMQKFVAMQNMKNYAIWVHGIKGNARTLGADALADMAYEHELQSREENVAYVTEHWDELLTVWNRALEGFQAFLGRCMS